MRLSKLIGYPEPDSVSKSYLELDPELNSG